MMAENKRRMKKNIRCTEITMINDGDGGILIAGESLGRWGTILVHTNKYLMAPELPEDADVIPCENITWFQNDYGVVCFVGESQERGVITLWWSPSPQKKMSLNEAQPALFT